MTTEKLHPEEFISLSEFKEFMYSKIVPLQDLSDTNGKPLLNSLPYWRKHGLLPFVPDGKWSKLSFAQLIWIRMLDSLRSLGYSIENTKTLCDYLFRDAYNNNLPERNIKSNKDALLKKRVAGTLTDHEILMLEQIEKITNEPAILHFLKYDINYLTLLITSSISIGEEAGLLIFYDGEIGERIGNQYTSHISKFIDYTKPHIYLSVSYFLKEFINSEELNTLVVPQLLNNNEIDVLRELRNKNIREITITRKGEDKLLIKSSYSGSIKGKALEEIKRILALSNYEEINVYTRDEKTLNFKRTKKKESIK